MNEDTREKLEADACTFIARAWEDGRTFERRDSNTRCEDVAWSSDELIDLLDRQAAITEREGREEWHKAASGEIYQAKQEADELRAKYNDLLERRTKVECDCDCCKWQEERDERKEMRCEMQKDLTVILPRTDIDPITTVEKGENSIEIKIGYTQATFDELLRKANTALDAALMDRIAKQHGYMKRETCIMSALKRYCGDDPSYRCSNCGHENYEIYKPSFCPNCGAKVVSYD